MAVAVMSGDLIEWPARVLNRSPVEDMWLKLRDLDIILKITGLNNSHFKV